MGNTGYIAALMLRAIAGAALVSFVLGCGGEEGPPTVSEPVTADAPAATATPDAALGCRRVPAAESRPECFYTGPVFDTHLHLGTVVGTLGRQYGSVDGLLGLLTRDGIDWAIGFYGVPAPSAPAQPLIDQAQALARGARSRIVPLIQPNHTEDFPQGAYGHIGSLLSQEGSFVGVGELALYFPAFRSMSLQHPAMQAVYGAVSEHRGVVMIHPRSSFNPPISTPAEIRGAIAAFPDVLFLFHGGGEIIDLVLPLMEQFPNVYFTWDFATWPKPGVSFGSATSTNQGSSAEFLGQVEQSGIDRIVDRVVREIEPRLAKQPDRIMWGTDRFLIWHFDDSTSGLVMEISRLVLARLPAELREKYAYQNALRVFGRFLNPPR
jgi:hypothetical protein